MMRREAKRPTSSGVKLDDSKNPSRADSASRRIRPGRRLIGELLNEAGLVTDVQIQDALRIQSEKGGKIVEILLGMNCFTPEDFVTFLAKQPGVASINLSNYHTSPDLVHLVPVEFALEHEVFPIDRMGKLLTLGMACPLDSATIRELEQETNLHVKPLLCTADDIRKAINLYYRVPMAETSAAGTEADSPAQGIEDLEASLRLSNVARLLRLIEKLPALPETVERLREMMADPDVSLANVANAIALDPPVAAKVLGAVNSAAYGISQRVDDLNVAVSLLGLKETYSLVLSCSVVNMFERSKTFDYREFWVESMSCASAARMLANRTGNSKRFGIFAAALLHDLGRVALSEVAPELYGSIDQGLPVQQVLEEEERKLAVTHAEAGYQLAQAWGLPPEIAEPIRFHHTPQLASEAQVNVAITAIAAALAHATACPDADPNPFIGLESALSELELTPVLLNALWEQFQGHNAANAL